MSDKNIIYEKVKRARELRLRTNCYGMELIEKADKIWELDNSFLFSYDDHGINRLVYFVNGWESLDKLISSIDTGIWFLEFMTKDPEEYRPYGSTLVTRMLRLANSDCTHVFDASSKVLQFKGASTIENAMEEDSEEITKILWNSFVPEISHLLYANELKELIKARQITIHRTNGQIDALLQVDVMPKKFYINQVVNLGERKNIHALLLNRLENYISTGGKYLYAWVDERNVASIKFHEKYGMNYDGMSSVIYSIER